MVADVALAKNRFEVYEIFQKNPKCSNMCYGGLLNMINRNKCLHQKEKIPCLKI
jgi:hypothetical protein